MIVNNLTNVPSSKVAHELGTARDVKPNDHWLHRDRRTSIRRPLTISCSTLCRNSRAFRPSPGWVRRVRRAPSWLGRAIHAYDVGNRPFLLRCMTEIWNSYERYTMLSTTARRTRNMDIIQESFIVHIQSRCLFIPHFMSHTFSSPFRPSQTFSLSLPLSLPLIMHAFIFSYSGSSSTPRVNYPFPKEFQTTSSLSHTQCSIATHLNLLAFTEVVNVDVWVLWRCTACILRVAQATVTMNLAVAVPCLISVGADLTARIWLFRTLGNANTFGCVAVDVADTTSAAVNVGAGIVWRRRIVQLRTMTGEIL